MEPLIHTEDSGGIEQSAAELDKAGKLTRYLSAALNREAILLERCSELVRARGEKV